MTAYSAVQPEFFGLRHVDPIIGQQPIETRCRYRPPIAFGEGLSQIGKGAEWRHDANAPLIEMRQSFIKDDVSRDMMQTGFENAFAVEFAPQSHRSECRFVVQFCGLEIKVNLVGVQVDVEKECESGSPVFHHLRSPSGLRSGMIAFAPIEPECLEDPDKCCKVSAAAPEGVMIVIRPAGSDAILSGFLELPRRIPTLPVRAFRFKHRMCRSIGTQFGCQCAGQFQG